MIMKLLTDIEGFLFSKENEKRNAILKSIYESLINMCDTPEESINEIMRYKRNFKLEKDYNLYQYGNLLISNDDIRGLYNDYNSNIDDIIESYKKDIRYVTDFYVLNYYFSVLYPELHGL